MNCAVNTGFSVTSFSTSARSGGCQCSGVSFFSSLESSLSVEVGETFNTRKKTTEDPGNIFSHFGEQDLKLKDLHSIILSHLLVTPGNHSGPHVSALPAS